MSTSNLIEIQINALALAVLIQAKAKAKDEGEVQVDTYQKRYLAQPIADMTKGDIKDMVEKRVDNHMEGYLYRIDRLEKGLEAHGVRITQLEASRQPPEFVEKRT